MRVQRVFVLFLLPVVASCAPLISSGVEMFGKKLETGRKAGKAPLTSDTGPISFAPERVVTSVHQRLEDRGFEFDIPDNGFWIVYRNQPPTGVSQYDTTVPFRLVRKGPMNSVGAEVDVLSLPRTVGTPAFVAFRAMDKERAAAKGIASVSISSDGHRAGFRYQTLADIKTFRVIRSEEYPDVTVVFYGSWNVLSDGVMGREFDSIVKSLKTFEPVKK